MFRFKQFEIIQDKTAMKVGTDGVLLGAWTNIPEKGHALDIGTGTGLIALMLAQRSNLLIKGIELDLSAHLQSIENIENSPWKERVSSEKIPLQEFTSENKFNLIVSNPPFFVNSHKTSEEQRNLARHTDSLSFEDLLKSTSKLLSEEGIASFIIPFQSEGEFLKIANQLALFPRRICRVRGHKNSPIKRSLIELSFTESTSNYSELIIEISRHNYTEDYINLTKDFYLKM